MQPNGILETVLYATDLKAIETFYRGVMWLKPFARTEGRHVFFRCGDQVLLIFNPETTAQGECHVCFRADGAELTEWRRHHGIAIEADFEWPGGGRSIYFRDPCNNSIELAEPRIWGLD